MGSAGQLLQFFHKNNAFLSIFWPKYFKAITHQLKAFEKHLNVLNRISEVQAL